MSRDEQLLKIKDIQKILPICTSKIYALVSKNEFPKPIKIGRSSFWKLSSILEYINMQDKLNKE
ncbi:helix-turn-helix domain-containing protein [Arcobacter lanthieri]|uniref:helix-turn-helix transcriptional regulator n=1 Tax=Aliarcobacter lanthieri TaxID=1355374 RepID=UPI001922EF3D|nr:AlpA family phage regulatory protein [Aliarcobacter lanthieri]MBL3518885.1 helix-turn-helix domain-containing protein [Aliarcobacter lanthieri]